MLKRKDPVPLNEELANIGVYAYHYNLRFVKA